MTITKKDLHDLATDLKEHMELRFDAHEKNEQSMLAPIITTLNEHSEILHGPTKRNGMIRDVNLLKWIGGGGFLAGTSQWAKDFFNSFWR